MKLLITAEIEEENVSMTETDILPLHLDNVVHCLGCICTAEGRCIAMQALPIRPIVPNSSLDFFAIPNGCEGREGGSALTTSISIDAISCITRRSDGKMVSTSISLLFC